RGHVDHPGLILGLAMRELLDRPHHEADRVAAVGSRPGDAHDAIADLELDRDPVAVERVRIAARASRPACALVTRSPPPLSAAGRRLSRALRGTSRPPPPWSLGRR